VSLVARHAPAVDENVMADRSSTVGKLPDPVSVAPTVAPRGEGMAARVGAGVELPRNAVTGAYYRGKNVDRLLSAAEEAGYVGAEWAGFKQWLSVGRVVRKGEHGTGCITVVGEMRDEGAATTRSTGKRGVRGFRVFHRDQTDELAPDGGES
jgi:antirestriction protein ArdC